VCALDVPGIRIPQKDFTDWKSHDDYQKSFDRLLRDLKAGA
jgi:hypothetical protein